MARSSPQRKQKPKEPVQQKKSRSKIVGVYDRPKQQKKSKTVLLAVVVALAVLFAVIFLSTIL